ncbi:acylphosphatase [Devosia sp.]|uniref:acylphosphatase n=1 Tax=Devosia sp. TaxID=1871048 RepID=UPI003A8C94A0
MQSSARVIVTGKVQGVGYRAFVVRQATALGMDGWVRNRRDGSVEAVIAGDPAKRAQLLARLRVGPSHARVTDVQSSSDDEEVVAGFEVRPTA